MAVVEMLERYAPECRLVREATVSEAVLVEGGISVVNPGLLYLCEANQFAEFDSINAPGNVLIVTPQALPMKARKEWPFNVIVVKTDEKIAVVYEMLQSFFRQKRDCWDKKDRLIAGFLKCRNLQQLIDLGYAVLGNPMFVSDLSYHILGFNENVKVKDPSWPAKQEEELKSYERLKKLNDSGVFERLYHSDVPCIESFDYPPTRWMAHRIALNGKSLGHIAVVESEKPFAEMDLELLQFLCELVAVELDKEHRQQNQYDNPFEPFFIDLLEEKTTKPELIEKRAADLKLKKQPYLTIVTITPGSNSKRTLALSYMKKMINRLFGTEKSVVYQNGISILLDGGKPKVISAERENKLREFLVSQGMKAGISQHFCDMAQVKKYYRQAVKAIELGTGLKPEQCLFCYDDYAVDHLLEIASTQCELRNFCNPRLFELRAFDQQYQTDYCHNLYIFLLCDCSITETAKIFGIHRNTMIYRINKIEAFLNCSLDTMETKGSLWLSFKILTDLGETDFFSA